MKIGQDFLDTQYNLFMAEIRRDGGEAIQLILLFRSLLFLYQGKSYWVSQNLPQICTSFALVYLESIHKQMQYG